MAGRAAVLNMTASPSALDPVELTKLSAFELGALLNDIDMQYAAFSKCAVDAARALGNAEGDLELHDDPTTRSLVKRLKGQLKAAEIQLRFLSKRQSRIQTILRTMP